MWEKKARQRYPEAYKKMDEARERAEKRREEEARERSALYSYSDDGELDNYKMSCIVENCCKLASGISFGYPTKGYIYYKSSYVEERSSGDFDIKVYVKASCYKGASPSDVRNGVDYFSNNAFDKIKSRVSKYGVGLNFRVVVDSTEFYD